MSADLIPVVEGEIEATREELLSLERKHDGLTREIVLEAARNEASPLHRVIFNMPVEQAAEQYYLARSGELIRRFTLTRMVGSGPPTRAFLFVPSEKKFRSTEAVRANPSLAEEVARNMRTDLILYRNRYASYATYLTGQVPEALEHIDSALGVLGGEDGV